MSARTVLICRSSEGSYRRAVGMTVGGLGKVEAMAGSSIHHAHDSQGEQVRRLRLRADGQRPLAVNLRETISLTRKLFELRDAARRAR